MSTYRERLIRQTVGPCDLFVLPTPVNDVVSVRLSVDTLPDFGAGDELVQDVAVALLDRGSERRDRFQIAQLLEARGATLAFRSAGTRIRCSGRMLREDVEPILALIGELMTRPVFDEGELEKTRQRFTGAVRRAATDTAHGAGAALSRHIFPASHPGFMHAPEDELAAIEALTRERLREYHAARFRGRIRCVVVGDVDAAEVVRGVGSAFEIWPVEPGDRPAYEDPAPSGGGSSTVEIPDRPNLDVRLGHDLPMRRDDPEYDALRLGVFALGGNFSARLMARVRDELGLTYGIGSAISGVSVHHGGSWTVSVTLSADRLDDGLDATRHEVARFVSEGPTAAETAEKKETLAGRFVVGLATTGGLAATLLRAEENGFGVDYLDGYARRIESIDHARVTTAVRDRLAPGRLHTAIAGTLSG